MNGELDYKNFRHSAAFGKRIEYYVIGLMLKEGLDVFLPMVDDDAIDAVIKKLVAHGWQPIGRGENWYSERFKRLVKKQQFSS